jgi:hypothetical protein
MHHLKKHGVTLPMLVRRHAKAMELLVQHVREAPDPLAGSLLIFDLSGCSASKFLGMWGYIREIAPIDCARPRDATDTASILAIQHLRGLI